MALMLRPSNRIRNLFNRISCTSSILQSARRYSQHHHIGSRSVKSPRGGSNLQSKTHFSLSALSSLPEYKAAIDHDRQGNFSLASPLYQRAHEVERSAYVTYQMDSLLSLFYAHFFATIFYVTFQPDHHLPVLISFEKVLSSSTGVGSDMSVHVAMQLAKSYIHSAQYNQAEKILSVPPFTHLNNDGGDTTTVVNAQHLMSTLFLLKGDAEKASAVANVALNLTEGQDSSEIDITSYSACYGYKGKRVRKKCVTFVVIHISFVNVLILFNAC